MELTSSKIPHKSEGKNLTNSYTWFQDIDVINNFLFSIDEIASSLPEEIKLLGVGSGVGNLEYTVKSLLEEKYNKKVLLTLTDKIIDDIRKDESVEVVKADNKSLPFNDESFDLVIARSVTHYEKDNEEEGRVLAEINRVLKRHGCFITEAPYFVDKKEAELMRSIHSLLSKNMNLKTFEELINLHKMAFSNVALAKVQPDKLLQVERKDFEKRYNISDDIAAKVIELITSFQSTETPNVWVKETNFGWSVRFAILICRK